MRCASKEGTRKVITGIDGHKVHERMLVARRLLELAPGDGEWVVPYAAEGFPYSLCRLRHLDSTTGLQVRLSLQTATA